MFTRNGDLMVFIAIEATCPTSCPIFTFKIFLDVTF